MTKKTYLIGKLVAVAALLMFAISCTKNMSDDGSDATSGATPPSSDATTGATQTSGSIVKGRIGTGTITIDGQTVTDAYGLDFNKDGVLEFRIVNYGTTLQWEPANASSGPAMRDGRIALLQKHAPIGPSLDYAAATPALLPTTESLTEKFYVAFRLTFDSVYYGWAKVKYKNGKLEWDKCAYYTAPNATLTAGDDDD